MKSSKLLFKNIHRYKKTVLLYLFLLIAPFKLILGQSGNSSYNYNDVPLSKVLDDLSQKHHTKVAFDADKFNQLTITINFADNLSIDECYSQICNKYPIRFQLISGTYVFYEIEKEFNEIVEKVKKEKERQKQEEKEAEKEPIDQQVTIPRRIWVNFFLKDKENASPINNCVVRINGLQYKTDDDGYFIFRHATQRPIKITINPVGYIRIDTVLENSLDTTLTFVLTPVGRNKDILENENIQSITSLGDTIQLHASNKIDLNIVAPRERHNTIDILPQTIFIPMQANGFSLMGASLHESNYFLDAIHHYKTNYLSGAVSRFNEDFVQKKTIFQGGNGANIGGTLPGSIVMESAELYSQSSAEVGINPFNTTVKAGIKFNPKLSFKGTARRSNFDWLPYSNLKDINNDVFVDRNNNPIMTNHEKELIFSDYNANLTYLKSENNEMTFTFTSGKDDENYTYNFPQFNSFRIRNINSSKHWGASFTTKFQHQPNKVNIISVSTYSLDELTFKNIDSNEDSPTYASIKQNKITTQLRQHRFEWKSIWKLNNAQHQFGAGIGISDYQLDAGYFNPPYVLNYNSTATNSLIMPAFAYYQLTYTLFNHLNLRGGVRANLGDEFSAPILLPRFSASIDGKYINLYYKTGQYLQYVKRINKLEPNGSINSILFTPNKFTKNVPYSQQHIIGSQMNYKGFNLNIEAFSHKVINNTLIWQDTERIKAKQTIFDQGVKNYQGISIWNAWKFNNWNHELNYVLSETKEQYEYFNDGKEFTSFDDCRHRLQITESYKIKKWTFSVFWNFYSGIKYLSPTWQNGIPEFRQENNFSQLNFSIFKNIDIKKIHFNLGVSALNILDANNSTQTYNYQLINASENYKIVAKRKGLPFSPYLFLELKFK